MESNLNFDGIKLETLMESKSYRGRWEHSCVVLIAFLREKWEKSLKPAAENLLWSGKFGPKMGLESGKMCKNFCAAPKF